MYIAITDYFQSLTCVLFLTVPGLEEQVVS